ncbi:hypothetical protein [Flavimarina sp. Hel_I_48]|uniref:hypothetical protein n=1 Tax=Flavimarina sp. Hel_I_48 TaxID=1392488 RepID=UPI0004DF682B|nr:hypothetical protein [Flavimarina sp. Hel_I_48]
MPKKTTIAKRINTLLAISIVFLLILWTNRIDQKHFDIAQNSVNEVYNDRMVVQDYIFSISNVLFEKKMGLSDSLSKGIQHEENKVIQDYISDFRSTKLTISEGQHLEQLETDFERLVSLENKHIASDGPRSLIKNKIHETLESMHSHLLNLSEIQLKESKNLIDSAQKSLDTSSLLSHIEIAFLIITGIAVQFIIFYRVKKTS